MKILVSMAFILLGTNVLADPDAGPGPSPVADPGRNNKASAISPVITREPMDKIAVRGKTERFECAAEGYPSPSISWLKDGNPFRGTEGVFVLPSGEIMFYNVKSSDEGTYTCLARNSAGITRSRNATLQVAYIKEEFRTIPEDRVAAVGGTAEIRCEGPKGVPEPRISWKKDGRELPQDGGRIRIERGRLVISGATKADSGSYQCIASNRAGKRDSVKVLLAVHEPPVFTVKPEDQTVVVGGDLELACEARGDPKPRIRWTKPDGVQNSRVVSLSNGNLRITNVQPGDDGEYVCSAENIVKAITHTATVTVNGKPEFVRRPMDKTARVGSSVTIPCWAEGKPDPTILWHALDGPNMFPGNPYDDGHIAVTQRGDLTIYNVQFSDQGQYVCEAYNPSGVIKVNARLTVKSRESEINPPVIKQGPSNTTVAQGASVELKCTSSAVPAPDFIWTKVGSGDVKTGTRFTITNSGSLKISSVQYGDAGRYTCKATNDYGWSQWDATVKVAAKGTPTTPPSDNMRNIPGAPTTPVLVNSTANTVTVKWSPSSDTGSSAISGYILEYYCLQSEYSTWIRVGGTISSAIYTIRGLKSSSEYVFLARTRNNHGTSDPSRVSETFSTLGDNSATGSDLWRELSQITVRVTSATPLSSATSGGGSGIRLQWSSSANCNFIEDFKIYLQPVSIRRGIQRIETVACYAGTTDVKNLQPRVVYEIRIRPFKADITGRPSPIILASPESEGADPKPPVLKVEEKSANDDAAGVVVFTWDPPESILPEYITRYTIRCKNKNNPSNYDITKDVNSSVTKLTLRDIPRGGEYTAFVTFSTQLGEGIASQKVDFSVNGPVPTSAPPSGGGLTDIMSNPGVLAGIAACAVVVIAIVVGVVLYRRHKRNKKGRGLHGRSGISMEPFSGTQYSKGFTMSLSNAGNRNFGDGTGSSAGNANGNIYMEQGGMTGPSATRNTTVSLNNGNGNVGTSLSPEMRSTARQNSSFSYVTDQLTSMSSIPPQFSSPNMERTPPQVLSSADFQLQLQQQQQYQRQVSDNPTILAGQLSPQGDLIDMNTPTDARNGYFARDNNLPPPPPSPPMSQKTSLSDRTNRSRGSSRNSAERASNHSSKGRRSRERNRGFQPLERVATDTDTGIDSPQQTPSPPRPSDLRAEHPSSSQPRGPTYPYGSKQHSGRRRNDGIATEYGRSADPNLGYLGGPSEGETESEVGGMRHGRTHYIPHPEEVRNSVAASSISMMNRYDSESSDRSSSPTSSVESLNMASASQVGVNDPQNTMPQRSTNSAFVPVQTQNQFNGGGTPNRGGYAKPKVPKKNHKDQSAHVVNGHYNNNNNHPHLGAQEQFINRINSASSSGSSSYHQNTADSGMSAGQGSYGHNSTNSSSSVESGTKGQMSRSRTTGSLSAESQPLTNHVENGPHFASVDRRYMQNNPDNSEYQQPRGRLPAPQPRKVANGSRSPQRKTTQDSNLSLPSRDGPAYIDYDTNGPTDRQPMLPDQEYRTNESELSHGEDGRTQSLAVKSVFASNIAGKPARGRHPELSDVPEVTTSDFCEEYGDGSP